MADEKKKDDEKPDQASVASDVAALLTGLKTTLTETFRPVVTTMYPEEKTPRSERYRGRHYLRRYENRLSPGERYAKTYEINMLRCIFCGYCEEACPVQAIVLGPEYELSDTSREKFIYTKEKLLEPLPPDVQARLDAKEAPSPPPSPRGGEG